MTTVTKLHKTDLDKAIELLTEANPEKVLIIYPDEDGMIRYIAPAMTSIYEVSGWCQAVGSDVLSGEDY